MNGHFTVNKGFLSILGLILLLIMSSVATYTQVLISSSRNMNAELVYEKVIVLKSVQTYLSSTCASVVEEEEDNEDEGVGGEEEQGSSSSYEFTTNNYTYLLDEDYYLFRNQSLYIEFIISVDACSYIDYIQH